jgi:aminopeptidase N
MYRPEAEGWREAARYMRHATSFHAERWGPYIYPHISAAEGPIGGMEYPMLVFIGGSRTPQSLYSVLSHEIAHEWWPMMVGSNESLYAWQDEGLVSYVEDLSMRDFFDDTTPELDTQDAYLRIAGSDAERPIMTEPDLFGIGPQYGVAAYTKPGTLLRALAGVIGEDALHRGLREYTTHWLLRHPSPFDFFNVIEDVHGDDLDWFWSPWFYDTAVLDQAVTGVSVDSAASGARVTITIEDLGDAPMPVLLAVTLADGSTREERLPVEPWLAGAATQTLTLDVASPVTRVEIDPQRYLPDVERANNVWTRQ